MRNLKPPDERRNDLLPADQALVVVVSTKSKLIPANLNGFAGDESLVLAHTHRCA